MIKNERQYKITKAQSARFVEALEQVSSRVDASPSLKKLEVDALKSQLSDLDREIREYERLRSSRRGAVEVRAVGAVPTTRGQARL